MEAVLSEVLQSQHHGSAGSLLSPQSEPPGSHRGYVLDDDRVAASTSHSLGSLDKFPALGEEVLLGARTDGRMSVARRFFSLFVLFDLLLTGLTWLICVMVSISNLLS